MGRKEPRMRGKDPVKYKFWYLTGSFKRIRGFYQGEGTSGREREERGSRRGDIGKSGKEKVTFPKGVKTKSPVYKTEVEPLQDLEEISET